MVSYYLKTLEASSLFGSRDLSPNIGHVLSLPSIVDDISHTSSNVSNIDATVTVVDFSVYDLDIRLITKE